MYKIKNKSIFSLQYECPFEYMGISFKSLNHWLIANKCILFEQYAFALKAIESKNPARMKVPQEMLMAFDYRKWGMHLEDVLKDGIRMQLEQNKNHSDSFEMIDVFEYNSNDKTENNLLGKIMNELKNERLQQKSI